MTGVTEAHNGRRRLGRDVLRPQRMGKLHRNIGSRHFTPTEILRRAKRPLRRETQRQQNCDPLPHGLPLGM